MKWDWRKSFKLNSAKILGHNAIEYSWIGGWYIALEGDPMFWPIGIAGAVAIHFVVFNILDIFHDHHHHHWNKTKGHAHHKEEAFDPPN